MKGSLRVAIAIQRPYLLATFEGGIPSTQDALVLLGSSLSHQQRTDHQPRCGGRIYGFCPLNCVLGWIDDCLLPWGFAEENKLK